MYERPRLGFRLRRTRPTEYRVEPSPYSMVFERIRESALSKTGLRGRGRANWDGYPASEAARLRDCRQSLGVADEG